MGSLSLSAPVYSGWPAAQPHGLALPHPVTAPGFGLRRTADNTAPSDILLPAAPSPLGISHPMRGQMGFTSSRAKVTLSTYSHSMGKPLGARSEHTLLVGREQNERRVIRYAAHVVSCREEGDEVAAVHEPCAFGHILM